MQHFPLHDCELCCIIILSLAGAQDACCAKLQDDLTDEMVELAAGLKRNAQAMQQSVTQRGVLLEETDESIERNLAAAQKSVKRAKEEHTRSIFFTLCRLPDMLHN